jgi:hypothetical protein
MVLAHSAAALLRLATIGVSGVDSLPDQMPRYLSDSPAGPRRESGMNRMNAMRYCGMAITALVESNRSANFFTYDVAGILSLIAKETSMEVSEWTTERVVRTLEARAAATEWARIREAKVMFKLMAAVSAPTITSAYLVKWTWMVSTQPWISTSLPISKCSCNPGSLTTQISLMVAFKCDQE